MLILALVEGRSSAQQEGDPNAWSRQSLPQLRNADLATGGALPQLRLEDPDPEPEARRYTSDDVLLARTSASPIVQCLIDSEIGRAVTRGGVVYPAYDPYMPGMAGEVGPGQLHPRGKLRRFYEVMGPGSDPHSPFQVVAFIEHSIRAGDGHHWTGYPGCSATRRLP